LSIFFIGYFYFWKGLLLSIFLKSGKTIIKKFTKRRAYIFQNLLKKFFLMRYKNVLPTEKENNVNPKLP